MNNNAPIMITDYPRAILHVDGDAFFASVEQALEPSLRGKPVATGKERGIIACANYEAKRFGIQRGLPIFAAQKLCPQLIVLPNDYETYSLYSQRMFDILRRYTPMVEEYSIDEAFADLTGVRRLFRCSYEELARKIQIDIRRELNITVSVGLSVSKSLAKLCSKFRKPNGFTAVPGNYIHLLLQRTPLEKVWGFGHNTVSLLQKLGLRTAYDFVQRPEQWVARLLHKPGRDIWNELRGNMLWPVNPEAKTTSATIIKSKTFTPPSSDRQFVYAQLVRNVEDACMKARRHQLRPKMLGIVLRHQDFHHDGLEAKLNRATACTVELLSIVHSMFDRIFREGSLYRATMIVLGGLESDRMEQFDLFEDRVRIATLHRITRAVDTINLRFGRRTVCSAATLYLQSKIPTARDEVPARHYCQLPGETPRRRLAIPRWTISV